MPPYLNLQEWLSVIRREYLQDFVRNGGSAVKFVLPVHGVEPFQVKESIRLAAEAEAFHFVHLDAASARIHMIDQIFHSVAKTLDWDDLAYSFLRNILRDHYKLPENRVAFTLQQIALLNGSDEAEMRGRINNRLRDSLYRDYAMTQEFRLAMLRLCQAQLDPVEVPSTLSDALKAWLRGELRLISAVKPAMIFQKIGRHNARHLLFSLSHWLKVAGKGGLVLTLDISRYMSDRPKEPDGTLYYSRAAVLDCYEVLRQFIDATDESAFMLIIAIAGPQFTDPQERQRGLFAYEALMFRIWDEVYDKVRVNPLHPLLRVSTCSTLPEKAGSGSV